jgi:Zn-dependent peptidase ImmA (M78 family)
MSSAAANAFAAALLMPTSFLETAITRIVRQNDRIDTETLIRELADRFRVSQQAMEYRLANVGLAVPR